MIISLSPVFFDVSAKISDPIHPRPALTVASIFPDNCFPHLTCDVLRTTIAASTGYRYNCVILINTIFRPIVHSSRNIAYEDQSPRETQHLFRLDTLMKIARSLTSMQGIDDAAAIMATEPNLQLLDEAGLAPFEVSKARSARRRADRRACQR